MPRPDPSSPLPHHSAPLGYIYPLAQAWLKQSCSWAGRTQRLQLLSCHSLCPLRPISLLHFISAQSSGGDLCAFFSVIVFKLSDLFAQFSTSAAQWNESQFLLTVAWHGRCDSRSCWWETGITQGYTSTPGRGMNCVKSFRWLQSWGLTEILLARARCITDGEAAAQVMHGNYNEQSGGEKTNLLCIFLTFSGGILS